MGLCVCCECVLCHGCVLQAAQEVRRLPLLAGAAALANPTLIAAPGVRNIGAPGSGTVPTVILTQTQTPSSHADTL